MNTDQINSLVRGLTKFAGGLLIAHGATKAATVVNAEDFTGLVITIVGFVLSHLKHSDATPKPPPTVLLLVLLLPTLCFTGCADLNTTAFRLEKLYADQATAAVSGFNQYYALSTNGAPADKIATLNKDQAIVYDAARKSAAILAVTEASRLAYSTNATTTAKAVLNQNLSSLGANSSNVTNVVATAMAPFATLPPK